MPVGLPCLSLSLRRSLVFYGLDTVRLAASLLRSFSIPLGLLLPPLGQHMTHVFLTLSQKMHLEAPVLVGLQSPMPTGQAVGEEEEASWKK